MTDTPQFDAQRRTGRVTMRVPIEVRGKTEDGTVFEESTHTSTIGGMGALIRLSHFLEVNSEIEVTNRFSQQTARFRVAWLGAQNSDDIWEIGIEAMKTLDDFWECAFLPSLSHVDPGAYQGLVVI